MRLLSVFMVILSFWAIISEARESRPRPAKVNIGAIFTMSTINGKVSKIAIKAAEEDVNSDESILGGTKLSINFHDSNFSGFLGIIGGTLFFFSFFCLFLY